MAKTNIGEVNQIALHQSLQKDGFYEVESSDVSADFVFAEK